MTIDKGLKYDSDKADLSLLPKAFLDEVARVMMLGEKKYGRYNYTKGHEASRLIAAAMRHLTAWMDGESNDPESGRTHLAHVACCMLMAIHQQSLGTLVDNRLVDKRIDATKEIPTTGIISASSIPSTWAYGIDEKDGRVAKIPPITLPSNSPTTEEEQRLYSKTWAYALDEKSGNVEKIPILFKEEA